MRSCFSFDEIREIEDKIINFENVPSIILMENAGKNACDVILNKFPDISEKEIFIICGKGNNAGDGFTLARHLHVKNVSSNSVMLVSPKLLKDDALINYGLLKKNGGEFLEFIEFIELSRKFSKRKNIIIIDAILGTGIKGMLDDQFLNVIVSLNKLKEKNQNIKIISLDVPSGVMSGQQVNPVINADMTVSMGTYKTELMFGVGKEHKGEMSVVSIGIAESMLDKYNVSGKYLVEFEDVQKLFPRRKKVSHKYSNGKVLIIGGSKGLSGAIAMSSISALKSGAGAVVAAIPKCISPTFNRKLFEAMTVELDETSDGTIKSNQFENIRKRIDWADVVLLGPGISTNDDTKEFVIDVIKKCEKPMIIDADGLNNLSYDLSILKGRPSKSEIFLTPHPGEFSRLLKVDVKQIELDRFALLNSFVEEYNVNVSLKSETTVSCFKSEARKKLGLNGTFYINSSGNEALASAGSGDVLSGIIASMYAQTKNAFKTLICGNYLHGYCANLYEQKYRNRQTAAPQDIIKMIPNAITKIIS